MSGMDKFDKPLSSAGTKNTQSWDDQVMMWVLMSILYGEGENGADLACIISASDYINHAIISYPELQVGLTRLQSLGVIRKQHSKVYFTTPFREEVAGIEKQSRSLHKKWQALEAVLKTLPGGAERYGDSEDEVFFNEQEVQQSVDEYMYRNQVK
jgi:hypothetical protein